MKIFTLMAAMLFFQLCHAQDSLYTFKKQWPTYLCFAGAGACYGTAEGLIWHTNNSESSFWNPYKSYRTNKTFDAYHLARAGGIGFFVLGATFSVNDVKHKLCWGMLKKIALSSLFYWAGQQVTWHTVR